VCIHIISHNISFNNTIFYYLPQNNKSGGLLEERSKESEQTIVLETIINIVTDRTRGNVNNQSGRAPAGSILVGSLKSKCAENIKRPYTGTRTPAHTHAVAQNNTKNKPHSSVSRDESQTVDTVRS